MVSTWLTQLGDWNPQLLREVKGRLKRRSLLVTVAVSLVTQFLIVGHYWRIIGSTVRQTDSAITLRDGWFQVFNLVTWIGLVALLFFCSYLLVKDLAQEEQRGTLDFVRLSPVSAQSVLVGKLLGVPILVYLAIALALPLHLWAATHARLSLLTIISVYLLAVASYGFMSGFAMLHSLSWGAKAQVWYVLPIPCMNAFPLYGLKVSTSYHYQLAVAQRTIGTATFEPEQQFFVTVSGFSIMFAGLALILYWACLYRFHHPPLRC